MRSLKNNKISPDPKKFEEISLNDHENSWSLPNQREEEVAQYDRKQDISEPITYKKIKQVLKKYDTPNIDNFNNMTISYVINIFIKILTLLILFILISAASFFNRWTIIDLMSTSLKATSDSENQGSNNTNQNEGWIYPIYPKNNQTKDDPILTPYFYSCLSILVIPEGVSLLIYLVRSLSKHGADLSFSQILVKFWPIFILDILSSMSSTWYLFIVYISSPSYLIIGITLCGLWLPSVVSFWESLFTRRVNSRQKAKVNLLLDFLAVLLNSIIFILTIYQYYKTNLVTNNSTFLKITLIFCPLFQFSNLIYSWIPPNVVGDRSTSLKNNRLKIAILSSLTKIPTTTITLFLTQFFMHSPVFDDENLKNIEKDLWVDVLAIILTGAVINFLSFTVLQFDGYGGILPLGFGPVVGNMVMMVCGYFGCSEFSVPSTYNRSYMHNETMIISGNKTQETVFFNHGLTCLYQDSAKLNQKYVMLIYILVGLPGWMLTCRHIYAKTPIRFLDYSSLFSCGVLFSSIRTWRCV